MIEIGYGLNVCGLEIIIIYDVKKEEFVVYFLKEEFGKEYIGNVFYGELVIVFG